MSEILTHNSEIIGTISSVKNENNKIRLIFTIYKEIEIPQNAIPIEKLESVVGKKIGIFHSDNDVYILREIKYRKH
jgi:hypothetical protein